MSKKSFFKTALMAACLSAAGASQAAVQVYTDSASFLAAVTAAATDTFDNLTAGTPYASPMTRSAGTYGYTASVTRSDGSADTFYPAGGGGDSWLSPNVVDDTISFTGFTSPIYAIGGLFFGTNFAGAFAAGLSLDVTISDGTTTTTSSVVNGTTSSFLGFVSSTAIVSMSVTEQASASPTWPTINNLVVAVPEPQTYALMLAGLAMVGASVRRRAG